MLGERVVRRFESKPLRPFQVSRLTLPTNCKCELNPCLEQLALSIVHVQEVRNIANSPACRLQYFAPCLRLGLELFAPALSNVDFL